MQNVNFSTQLKMYGYGSHYNIYIYTCNYYMYNYIYNMNYIFILYIYRIPPNFRGTIFS